MKGCVYFFRHIAMYPVKIGCTDSNSPLDRFLQFKTYAPFGAEILGVIISNEPFKLEKKIHKLLNNSRMEGEWFDISEKKVNELIAKFSKQEDIEDRNNFQIEWTERLLSKSNKNSSKFPFGVEDMISNIDFNVKIDKKNFSIEVSNYIKYEMSVQTAMNYVRLYCNMKKKTLKLIEGHSGSFYWFLIQKK